MTQTLSPIFSGSPTRSLLLSGVSANMKADHLTTDVSRNKKIILEKQAKQSDAHTPSVSPYEMEIERPNKYSVLAPE